MYLIIFLDIEELIGWDLLAGDEEEIINGADENAEKRRNVRMRRVK